MTFNAKADYTADGSQSTTYSITFNYLLAAHVVVQVGADYDNLSARTEGVEYEGGLSASSEALRPLHQ